MNWTAVVPLGQQLAQRAPLLLITGLCAGSAPALAPHLSKESEQGGREETTTWEWNPGITADSIHGHLVGIHIISLTMNTRRGTGEGDMDRLKPLNLTNHRSIRHQHRTALSSDSANTLFPLLSSASWQAICEWTSRPSAPLLWHERSHDQRASTRSRTDWLTAQVQPRHRDPEGVNSTISELFHMTQQSGWQIKGWRIG